VTFLQNIYTGQGRFVGERHQPVGPGTRLRAPGFGHMAVRTGTKDITTAIAGIDEADWAGRAASQD
jgi:hypothetical protein